MSRKQWELYISMSGRIFLGTFEGNEKAAIKEAERLAEKPGLDRETVTDVSLHDVEVEEQ